MPPLTATGIFYGRGLSKSIVISPNPNNGNFKLELNNINGSIEEITVYDFAGQQVGQLSSVALQALNAEYPKGVYFIRVVTDKGIHVQKMIIE